MRGGNNVNFNKWNLKEEYDRYRTTTKLLDFEIVSYEKFKTLYLMAQCFQEVNEKENNPLVNWIKLQCDQFVGIIHTEKELDEGFQKLLGKNPSP
jgi:hypothetical protein